MKGMHDTMDKLICINVICFLFIITNIYYNNNYSKLEPNLYGKLLYMTCNNINFSYLIETILISNSNDISLNYFHNYKCSSICECFAIHDALGNC